jgi:hypothetical protein
VQFKYFFKSHVAISLTTFRGTKRKGLQALMINQPTEGCDFSIPPPLAISPTKSEPAARAVEFAETEPSMTEGSISPLGPLSSCTDANSPTQLEDDGGAPRSILDTGRQAVSSSVQKSKKTTKGIASAAAVDPAKAKKPSKRLRDGQVEDTAAADSRAAFRHSQRLLRKSAPSLDLKAALHRSFSQQHASPPSASPTLMSPFPLAAGCDSQNALSVSPVAAGSDTTKQQSTRDASRASSSVHDVTQRFLSKVHEQKQQVIRTLVTRREASSLFNVPSVQASGVSNGNKRLNHSDDVEDDVELIVDSVHSRQTNSNSVVTSRSGRTGLTPVAPLSSPLFAAVDDSRSSASQLSPTFSQPDERSSPPQELLEEDNDDVVNIKQEVSLISALQRKHELLKFKKQHQQQQSLHQTPLIPLPTLGPRSVSSGNLNTHVVTSTSTTLLHQRTLLNTFHVSATDVSFLKRTNSFENSQSQSIVFRKDSTAPQ